MKITIGEKLLTSYASHGDEHKFIADCFDASERVKQFGCDEKIFVSIFYFADGSRIEHGIDDAYVRCFNPF